MKNFEVFVKFEIIKGFDNYVVVLKIQSNSSLKNLNQNTILWFYSMLGVIVDGSDYGIKFHQYLYRFVTNSRHGRFQVKMSWM